MNRYLGRGASSSLVMHPCFLSRPRFKKRVPVRGPRDSARSEESKRWTTTMESGSNTITTRAKRHSICTRHQEKLCLSKSSQSWSPIYSSLAAKPCHENWNFVTKSSQEPKLHDKGGDTTQPLASLLASSPCSFIGRRENNSIHQSKKYQGAEKNLLKMGLSLPKYFLFIDAEAEPLRIQIFQSTETVLHLRFFGMSDQLDSI